MNIIIKTKDIDLTPSIKNYVEEKIGSLEKFIHLQNNEEILAEVEVGRQSKHHKKGDVYRAELNLAFEGKQLRAVSSNIDMFSAIDEIREEMTNIIRRDKNKKEALFRRGARKIKNMLRWK